MHQDDLAGPGSTRAATTEALTCPAVPSQPSVSTVHRTRHVPGPVGHGDGAGVGVAEREPEQRRRVLPGDREDLLRATEDHAVHQGELIASASAAASLTLAFRHLFTARFPIRQMRAVDDFGGDDERSMLADNTSAFNCRLVPGTSAWAQHAYGLAVDINPLENPEIRNGQADPPAAAAWADWTRRSPINLSVESAGTDGRTSPGQ